MDDEQCNEQLLGLEMRRLDNNEGTDDLYNNIANIYRRAWYKIDLNEEDMVQAVGFNKQLQYQVYKDNDIIDYKVKWSSSNPEVAKVSEDGMLSIVGIGKSIITCYLAENDEIKATVNISGIKKENLPMREEYVINPLNLDTILKGDTQTISFHHNVDEVSDGETFNLKLSGVPYQGQYANYYFHFDCDSGSLVSCNEITITNIRPFTKGKLKIEIYSNITGNLIGTMDIRLGNVL